MIHIVPMWISVDYHLGYPMNVMEEAVTDLLGDGVGLLQRQLCVGLDVHRDVQCMPDPARAYVIDVLNARYGTGDVNDIGYHARVYRVQEPLEDTFTCRVNDGDDDDGDEQSRDGVGD